MDEFQRAGTQLALVTSDRILQILTPVAVRPAMSTDAIDALI
ncbi:hypothetical protein AC578_1271 [Pseudocercospora eumusae]|uniref:Uncharacterized protein n=1 Tax=Pseudocercospora eumusae TaxID=321146 RepID=A0A139HUJ2_9PEZI|nr:hypothetical protein AC578_1271 [Pseudocercospora eumusae]